MLSYYLSLTGDALMRSAVPGVCGLFTGAIVYAVLDAAVGNPFAGIAALLGGAATGLTVAILRQE